MAPQCERVGWVVSGTFLPAPPPRAEPGTNTGTRSCPRVSPAPSKQETSTPRRKRPTRLQGKGILRTRTGEDKRDLSPPAFPHIKEVTCRQLPSGCKNKRALAQAGVSAQGNPRIRLIPTAAQSVINPRTPASQAAVATAQNNAAKQLRESNRLFSREGSTSQIEQHFLLPLSCD